MGLLIADRLLTKVGAPYLRNARILAKDAYAAKLSNKYQIINGFLLRATGRWTESDGARPTLEKGSYIASVIDTPGFVLFAGTLRRDQADASLSYIASASGIRDDFTSPGTAAEFTASDKNNYFIQLAPAREDDPGTEVQFSFFHSLRRREWLMGFSRIEFPLKKTSDEITIYSLDDENVFDFSTRVGLTGSITSFFHGGRSVAIDSGNVEFGPLRYSYFFRNQYSISEDDLPGGWKFYVRRLISLDITSRDGDIRRFPKHPLVSGFDFSPASSSQSLEGIDRYCHAANVYRQSNLFWGPVEPITGYDRDGEQALMVAVGEMDRADYNPETGDNLFAATSQINIYRPQDIEQSYLHPDPEFLPADPVLNKPSLPNFGSFLVPTPARLSDGFAVFSVYTTLLNRDGFGADGDAWSLITTLPNGRNISLRADWDYTLETIPTGVDGEFMYPWIVGADSIDTEGTTTAYCIVWEQTYVRGTDLPLKGQWAIYSTSGGTPVRRTVTGFAPLFSIWQINGVYRFNFPAYDYAQPFSSAYYAGDNKIVTACTDYPPSQQERIIRCAMFDVSSGSITAGGIIDTSTDVSEKCFVTVAQQFKPAEAGGESMPAVLLATICSHLSTNRGTGGRVYISVDGGQSWRPYITDAGAQGGAFYVGNKLWKHDMTLSLDGRRKP